MEIESTQTTLDSLLTGGHGVLVSSATDPYVNLALEESLFDALPTESTVLLLYVNAPSVIIGRHQNPWKESAVPFLRKASIPLARRISGGGAVFHDGGNLNFSFLMPKHGFDRAGNLDMILDVLRTLGLDGTRSPMHDLLICGRKFSGNSFCFRRERALHHGTVLVSARRGGLSRALAGAEARIETHAVKSRRAETINLKEIVPDLTLHIVKDTLCRYFEGRWDCPSRATLEVDPAGLVRVRRAAADGGILPVSEIVRTLAERNRSWEWIYGRTPVFDAVVGGDGQAADRLRLRVENGCIVGCEEPGEFERSCNAIKGVRFDASLMLQAVEACGECNEEKVRFRKLLNEAYC